jgi:hypothetical protein
LKGHFERALGSYSRAHRWRRRTDLRFIRSGRGSQEQTKDPGKHRTCGDV